MTRSLLALLLAAGAALAPAIAQTLEGPDLAPVFAPLALPAPTAQRDASGRPGPGYWQNRNDYRITAALDPATHTVTGSVTLRYTNNSPHTLPYVWMHLEQNLFGSASRGALRTPPTSRWRGSFAQGGYRLGAVTVDGRTVAPRVDDTRMRLDLPEPLAANGGTVEITVPYSFVVPEYGADRMGRLETAKGTVYEIAQWYPRVAVYDDVNGWNALPYLGQGEFYLGYGDFEYEVTVPATMTVVGTGDLVNADDVFTSEQQARLTRARTSTSRVYVVSPGEVGTPAASAARSGSTTWRFRAENVRDVAWAASNAFILDAAGAAVRQEDGTTNEVLIQSAYPAEGIGTSENPGWEEATRFGRASILNNSRWYPFPYPVAISVAGVVGGMEYPMFQFSGVDARGQSLFGVVDHELGHNWFPMIVGSDERRYAWMDEGFNTFMNTFSNTAFYDQNEDPSIAGYGLGDSTRVRRLTTGRGTARLAREPYAQDQTIMTYPDRLRPESLGWFAYRKPGKGLLLLRDVVLGPERFDAAFETYIRRWAYKHPQPADFMRTIEDVSGEDLDWFWREWFYESGRYDAAIANLRAEGDDIVVNVELLQPMVFPVTVEVSFADGTAERATIPVEAFFSGGEAAARVATRGRTPV
ncbi:MAG TPA: M1 family metallopeptidase, partial [Rubricoccaceae bacterium]